MSKYNNYAEAGGDGQNKLAVLDPNATQTDPVTLVTVMKEVLTIPGPTPDLSIGGVKEWCINSAAVDPQTKSIITSTLLMGEHTRVVQRFGMVGGDVENPVIDLLRLSELLVFLQEDGDRNRLLESQFARWRF